MREAGLDDSSFEEFVTCCSPHLFTLARLARRVELRSSY